MGVTTGEILELTVLDVTAMVVVVRVHWALRRDDGSDVYDFTSVYTLAHSDGSLRIAAVAHDELPKLTAALNS